MVGTTKRGVGCGNPCTPHKPDELLILEVTRKKCNICIDFFFNYEFNIDFGNKFISYIIVIR